MTLNACCGLAGLDSFADHRWCSLDASQAICGARGKSCYGRCLIHSDLNFTVECDPNSLARCICDTFNTTFFTGLSGLPCDRDYVVQRLGTRDNVTQWCGILAESGTVRCRDVNDSRTCYQTDACLCQFDAGDGSPLGYVGFQLGAANGTRALNATNVNNATLNVTTIRRPVFAHCAYVYTVGTLNNDSTLVNNTVVSGASLYRKHTRRLAWLPGAPPPSPARRVTEMYGIYIGDQFRSRKTEDTSNASSPIVNVTNADVVLVDNTPLLVAQGVPMQLYGFSCDYQQRCGTFTEATITYCDTRTQKCNVTCGCYRGATTMVGTNVPCSAFVQSCDDTQRARCAKLLNVSYVTSCQATCDELNQVCEPLIGSCVVGQPVVIPRYVVCTNAEAARYCGSEFTTDSCKRKATCASDPPQADCFVCDCAQRNGYLNDPSLRYGHYCTNLRNEYFNCTAVERRACGLRGVTGCKKSLIYGGAYDDLRGRLQFDDLTWNMTLANWQAGRAATNLLSGKLGGVMIQECTCLFDLFNAADSRRLTLTSFDETLRCDFYLTDYLTQRGTCPFRADTGMPCNGVGGCEGGSDEAIEIAQWPNELVAKGATFLTHGARWRLALTQGFVWLYANATTFTACNDSWCGGAPITGRVARQATPNNPYAGSPNYGFVEGTPAKCVSVGAAYSPRLCSCPELFIFGRRYPYDQELKNFTVTVPSMENCVFAGCTATTWGFTGVQAMESRDATTDYLISGSTVDGAKTRSVASVSAVHPTCDNTNCVPYPQTIIPNNQPLVNYPRTMTAELDTSKYYAIGGDTPKNWDYCVLRRRSKSPAGCYVDTPNWTPTYSAANQFMGAYDSNDPSAHVCRPKSEQDVEYAFVCTEPVTEDVSRVRQMWNDTNVCSIPLYDVRTCGCVSPYACGCPDGQFKNLAGACVACSFDSRCGPTGAIPCGYDRLQASIASKTYVGAIACSRYSVSGDTGRPSIIPGSAGWDLVAPYWQARYGNAVYSNPVFSTFQVTVDDNYWTTRLGRFYNSLYTRNERLDPALIMTVSLHPNRQGYAKDWLSGCVSATNVLRRATSTTEHVNQCTSWHAAYTLVSGNTDQLSNYYPKVTVAPRSYSELYCFVAKPTSSMFLWHGINNEDYYTGDRDALVSQIGPEFATVFQNLPNKCTKCLDYYKNETCTVQATPESFYVGWIGLCAAYNTCCGVDAPCAVPINNVWSGREGCIHGYFDFDAHHCVCDGDGWTYASAVSPDLGPQSYCNFNACARDPQLPVFTREFPDSTNPICSGRGTCLGPQRLCRCDDPATYGGRLCQLRKVDKCPGSNPAKGQVCSGHGECTIDSVTEEATCACFNLTGAGGYWTGRACDEPHTPDDATCRANEGRVAVHPTRDVPYCACPTLPGAPGVLVKGGQYCEYPRCPMANGKRCNGQGSCVVNGTNPSGYPLLTCRAPLDINIVCAPTDTQCMQTTQVPLVCQNPVDGRILDYDGCACEQPIRTYCAPDTDAPLCGVSSGTPIDQLSRCQVLTSLANGSIVASCQCETRTTGVFGSFCQSSVCGAGPQPCGTGTCDPDSQLCVCRGVDAAFNGLWEGALCNVSVSASCGYALVPGGDLYKCAAHGQCILTDPTEGTYSCACDVGYTGLKCELSDCPAPCDARSDCALPSTGGTQKECICRYPLVYSRNTTYPNLCNVDACAARNPRYRPNAAGDQCECIEPGVSFASGCLQPLCPTDSATGDVCGAPNPSQLCSEGDCIAADCQVSYDYTLNNGRWTLVGDSRRRLLCDRYQKRCVEGACACGLGYTQDAESKLCVRVCVPENTRGVVPCMDTFDPLCIDAGPFTFNYDHAFKCVCKPAYTGSRYCDTLLCAHGGTVIEATGSCDCPFPWTGDTCDDDLCINGVANFVNNTCDCLFGWSGARCDRNACENGGTPNFRTLACRCPAKWGGPTCSTINCRTNNFWDETLQRCVCPPGYKGDLCDVPDCNNNKLPDSSGSCVCASPGQTNQYMDPLCTYRWCGLGNRVCILGACMCICDDRRGVYLDPVTGNCTVPVCGPHASWSIASVSCACDRGYVKDTSVPLEPCIRDCGPYGTYNSISGSCICAPNYFGADCEYSTVAFIQPLIKQAVTLPNGIVVEPIDAVTELRIASQNPPVAVVQVVLFDPFPDAISYQEDAERALRQRYPGYRVIYGDLSDLVLTQGGRSLPSDPTNVVLGNVTLEVARFDNTLSSGGYAVSVAMIAIIAVLALAQVATYVIAIQYNMSEL